MYPLRTTERVDAVAGLLKRMLPKLSVGGFGILISILLRVVPLGIGTRAVLNAFDPVSMARSQTTYNWGHDMRLGTEWVQRVGLRDRHRVLQRVRVERRRSQSWLQVHRWRLSVVGARLPLLTKWA